MGNELQAKLEVKQQLARKYERLARLTSSAPRKKVLSGRAQRFWRQAREIERQAK